MTDPTTTPTPRGEGLAALIGTDGRGARKRRVRWLAAAGILVILAAIGAMAFRKGGEAVAPVYETEKVTRGTLNVLVSATGNLQPTIKVDVGSEVSGLVEAVLVDENDSVKAGQVIARLDTSKLKDSITRSQASLSSAEAKQKQAEATLAEAGANLNRLKEVSRLSGGKVPSRTEMETAEATLLRAQAEVTSAKAAVNESRASLNSDEINLSKASIRSPIDGVVLSRKVEPGQTVAASFQVATLFTIAQDLREMELEVSVDEALVGKVKQGQHATFTVDAYLNRKYTAEVTRVAYGSTTSNNVVTYTTTLRVKNDDLSLRPGMTATAEIACITRDHALLVPNAALHYAPAEPDTAPKGFISFMPRPPDEKQDKQAKPKTAAQQVWILSDGKAQGVPITVGETDGRVTEVTGGGLKDGAVVITDETKGTK
jgi:HlyD family secretion protein